MTGMNKKLGKRIQELRKYKGLTQSQLAEQINVETVTISRIENGSRFPKKENLIKLAEALDVEIVEFFDYEHHKSKGELLKEIKEILNNCSTKDLEYFYRLLVFHMQAKEK